MVLFLCPSLGFRLGFREPRHAAEIITLEPLAALRPVPPLPRRSRRRSVAVRKPTSTSGVFALDLWRIDVVEWAHSATQVHPLVEEERRKLSIPPPPTKGSRLDVRA